MKLQQLAYIREVAKRGLNVSVAADRLKVAQPGISNQIKLLEKELNVRIFERNGKRLTRITQPGRVILSMAERILHEVENLQQVSSEYTEQASGVLSIATTHTQASYALPPVVKQFMQAYPKVQLNIHQGNPSQIAEMVATGLADIAIATEGMEMFEEVVMLPCYEWNRCLVAPTGHPLLQLPAITLEEIVKYPIITYDFAFAGRSKINQAFASLGLKPNVVLTAVDSDVIKTYVALGLGVGVLAKMAFNPAADSQLGAVDASHLFESSTTYIGLRRGSYLRGYCYAFIECFSEKLDRKTVDEVIRL